MRVDVLGVPFDNITLPEAVDKALELISAHDGAYAVTPNPEIVWACRSDTDLRGAIESAALVLPDGVGIIYGAKILGTPLRARVPGIDFATALLREMAARGLSVFLLGASPGVAERAAQNLARDIPGLVISGTRDGYFTDEATVIEEVNAARPDVVCVCLGSPKQELFMRRHAGEISAGLMIGLGGSLDVFAGEAKRAPAWMQRLGLEWLYRLFRDPRRIGRMMRLPMFLGAVLCKRIFRKKNKA